MIGPEFRSAARGVLARHPYQELLRKNEQIENEIEADLRRRTTGKHVEIASVTLEAIIYAQDIARAVQDKLVAEQDAGTKRTLLENEATRRKLDLEHKAEQARISADAALKEKQQEAEIAKAQAALEKSRQSPKQKSASSKPRPRPRSRGWSRGRKPSKLGRRTRHSRRSR